MSHAVSVRECPPVGQIEPIVPVRAADLALNNAKRPQSDVVPPRTGRTGFAFDRMLGVSAICLLMCSCERSNSPEVRKPSNTTANLTLVATPHTSDGANDAQPAQSVSFDPERQELLNRREVLLALERAQQFPIEPEVTADETDADRRLCALRLQEIRKYKAENSFPPAISFSKARPMIEQSQVFRILRRMPKGGALHIHSTAAGRLDWLVQQLLQRDDCHVCWPESVYNGRQRTHLVGEIRFCGPNTVPTGFRQVRTVAESTPGFETKLREFFSLGPEDPAVADRWSEFNNCFARLGSALSNEPLFTAYFADAFTTLAADGVDYVELRSGFPQLYANDGTPMPADQAMLSYQVALTSVRRKYPDFDFRVIVSDWRGADISKIVSSFQNTVQMQKKYPGLIVGYDLVGKEDDASPTATLINVWPALRQVCQDENAEFPDLFLHDGESNWADDQNLIDAHLFNARRIGHGLDLYLFPAMEDRFRNEGVALEVCPISNQILGYVSDIRLHPANGYIRRGVPCVLSSDDPLLFGNEGLTYDFWVAYMAWDLDLVTVRHLILNSIDHSARTDVQKDEARTRFSGQWKQFVGTINSELPEPVALLCE